MITGNRKLFELAVHYGINNIEFLNEVYDLIDHTVNHELGIASCEFYDVLRRLHDSINNTDSAARRIQQITLINDEMGKISNKYEDFLP